MEFVLERYNYWIIILLMMGGLYIVFEAENMIKKLVGLGIFQTSLIIFYITLGKTAGGTAPILLHSGHGHDHHGDDHGGHAAAHGEAAAHGAHAAAGHGDEVPQEATHHANDHEDGHPEEAGDHSEAHGSHDMGHGDHESVHTDDHGATGHDAHAPVDTSSDLVVDPDSIHPAVNEAVFGHGGEPMHMAAGEIIYSNPLPHVLMLTAIVVGVATLSVGLALVVRVREAYGTIEMDEVRKADIADAEAEGDEA